MVTARIPVRGLPDQRQLFLPVAEDAIGRPWGRPNGHLDLEKLDRLVGRLIAATDPDRIVLFGSAARGQMTLDSDLDFLLIKTACNAPELARLGRNALPEGVPLDVIAATPEYLAEKQNSLSSLLLTAFEEGVTLFADRHRLPYSPNTAAARAQEAPNPEPPPVHARPFQPDEARSWLKHALYKLQEAEVFADSKPGEYMLTAETCGASRSGVESALKALIVAHGVRPRKYKKPPELAREAGAAGETLPQLQPHDLEAIGR